MYKYMYKDTQFKSMRFSAAIQIILLHIKLYFADLALVRKD
jgi:hypothetical protein